MANHSLRALTPLGAGARFSLGQTEQEGSGSRFLSTARRDVSERYQRSACLPITRPNIDMRLIASTYQIATNSGESFVQCIAKTVAPKAPARRPAAAPARAGDIGAPWRSA